MTLATRALIANSLPERMKGLIGRKNLQEGEGMVFPRCSQVHTFGMLFPIDVVFLDCEGRVIKLYHSLKPFRITSVVKGSRTVIELPAGVLEKTETKSGDFLKISRDT